MPSVLAQVDHSELAPAVGNAVSPLHAVLREATRPQHERVDEALSRYDLATAPSYRRFLLAHRDALTVLVERCDDDDRREFAPLLRLLHDDLDVAPDPCARGLDLPPHHPATAIGIAYVVRGSRLGTAFLRRRVGANLPARYLHHELATRWTTFLARLESTVPPTADARDAVVDAARMAFGVFARAADAQRPVTGCTPSPVATTLHKCPVASIPITRHER